jgi:hypothetical protein
MEKLKVGDSVRILRSDFKSEELQKGATGIVKSIGVSYTKILLYNDIKTCDGELWNFPHSFLEKILEPEQTSLETQIKQVLAHLQDNPITSWEAINTYKITRLSAVIYKLRKNYTITSVWEDNNKVGKDKKRWTKYTLIK